MRTMEQTVYEFDELSEAAKDRARDWYREARAQDFDADYVLEDAARLGDIIGITIRTRPVKLMGGGTRQEPNVYWSVGDRGDGASFAGSYSYAKDSVRKLAAEAPAEWTDNDGTVRQSESNGRLNQIAVTLRQVQRRNFYQIQAITDHRRYFGLDVDVERADGKPLSHDDENTVRECLEDFASWIHRQLESEWEYWQSNECIDENIRANEYEFTEEGERANG